MAKEYSTKNVRVARKNASTGTLLEKGFISESDKEMDDRANEAVKAAIRKHKDELSIYPNNLWDRESIFDLMNGNLKE